MKITIEFDHTDIKRADEVNFQGFFLMVQSFAKSLKEDNEKILRESVNKFIEEKNSAKNNSTAEKKFNRADIESEIKKIALEGKEKNVSSKIKEFIREYGFEKLNEVPDEKISELLEKVKAL